MYMTILNPNIIPFNICSGTIPLSEIFNDIKTFLDNNKNEIVTIILECYVSANDIENVINQTDYLDIYIHTRQAGLHYKK